MHILAVIMLHQHKFCVYKYFLHLNSFYFAFLENVEKRLQSGGFREGRSGYSKHNIFFSSSSPSEESDLTCTNAQALLSLLGTHHHMWFCMFCRGPAYFESLLDYE